MFVRSRWNSRLDTLVAPLVASLMAVGLVAPLSAQSPIPPAAAASGLMPQWAQTVSGVEA
jgi:hypothetical protein